MFIFIVVGKICKIGNVFEWRMLSHLIKVNIETSQTIEIGAGRNATVINNLHVYHQFTNVQHFCLVIRKCMFTL